MRKRSMLAGLAIALGLLSGVGLGAGAANAADYDGCSKAPNFTLRSSNSIIATIPAEAAALSNVCLLRQGDQGPAVRALQTALNACHGARLTVDGAFGQATRNAVVNMQRSVGATADGIYGQQTMNRMKFPTANRYNGSSTGCYAGSGFEKYGWWPGP